MSDRRPGKDAYDVNGVVHEQPADECPPDNLYPVYESHAGNPTPKDNNANGSAR